MHEAIGVDVFAGGLSVGVQRHFHVPAHFEHSDYGSSVVRLNHPDIVLHNHPSIWPRAPRYPGQKTRTRFIFANPPCAPFSSASAGRATAWHEDPRIQMFYDSMELLPQIEPDVMAIESVTNAWTKDATFGKGLAKRAAGHGYATTVLLHNAQWLGVPQIRKRVFYVFHKIAVSWAEPDYDRQVSVREAWKGLKIPASSKKTWDASLHKHHQEMGPLTKPGENCAKVFDRVYPNPKLGDRGQVLGRPSFLIRRLHLDKPSPVVIGDRCLIHPTETRSLYPEETAALVGFPHDYRWPPEVNLDKLQRMMSQGVSPLVGEWLAAGVAASIDRNKRINRPFLAVRDEREAPGGYAVLDESPGDWDGSLPALPPVEERPTREPRPTVARAPGSSRPGSGARIRELLVAGKAAAEILPIIHTEFPGSKATASDVAWNRGRLRKEGVRV